MGKPHTTKTTFKNLEAPLEHLKAVLFKMRLGREMLFSVADLVPLFVVIQIFQPRKHRHIV